jgi:hypothetical protein
MDLLLDILCYNLIKLNEDVEGIQRLVVDKCKCFVTEKCIKGVV